MTSVYRPCVTFNDNLAHISHIALVTWSKQMMASNFELALRPKSLN